MAQGAGPRCFEYIAQMKDAEHVLWQLFAGRVLTVVFALAWQVLVLN